MTQTISTKAGNEMGDTTSHPINLWDWVERILKVTGVLALFGYMSLRAHFSFLGISLSQH